MLLPLIFISATIICFAIAKYLDEGYDENFGWTLGWILSGVVSVIMLIAIPISRNDSREFLQKYKATKETIRVARESGNQYEIAALTASIIEVNQKLAEMKYYANGIWISAYYIPKIKNLQPLK